MENPRNFALWLLDDALSTLLDRRFAAWRQVAILAVIAGGALIIWLGPRIGWGVLLTGVIMEAGDLALLRIPYEPLKRQPNDMHWP